MSFIRVPNNIILIRQKIKVLDNISTEKLNKDIKLLIFEEYENIDFSNFEEKEKEKIIISFTEKEIKLLEKLKSKLGLSITQIYSSKIIDIALKKGII